MDEPDFDQISNNTAPAWVNYPAVANYLNDNSFHADIINHFGRRLNEADDMTDSHETTHMINADIRNTNSNYGSRRVNAFYVGKDRSIIFPEPNFSKAEVAQFVPESLRGFRFPTYITGMTEWNDHVLYVFDEFIAYVNGGATGVEQVESNTYKGEWTDGVSGCLEFSIYAVAVCIAIEKYDSQYLNNNKGFYTFVKWLLRRAASIYEKGSKMSQFKWDKQDQMLAALRGEKEFREFIKSRFGVIGLS